nr:Retrovirus-related Pol polyprotein from transposon RE1 [Ipomoea batatas]
MRLGQVSYSKLDMMMRKSMLRGLPQLEVRNGAVCAGCQYGKAHQLPYEESSKMEKKVVKCIFVGYDNQSKGWRCCDPTTGKCYTSRNVVFDEAYSWWSSPDSNSFKDVLESSQVKLSLGGNESADESGGGEVVVTQDQNGEHQQQSEYGDSNRVSTLLPLRRSTRIRKLNPNLFVKAKGRKLAIVLVYVDDLVLTSDDDEEILRTKENLSVRFKMKELGHLNHFLGLEIVRSGEGIFLHQHKYSRNLLKRFGMYDCKLISVPMELNTNERKRLEDATVYRQLVVGVMSRYMQNPKKPHLEAARRILRYVKGTLGQGAMYKRSGVTGTSNGKTKPKTTPNLANFYVLVVTTNDR